MDRYHFPDLKAAAARRAADHADSGPRFEPIFQDRSSGPGTGRDRRSELETTLDQARAKGYADGLQAGRAEGARDARTVLSPALDHFVSSYDNLAMIAPQLAELTADQVLLFARDMVARIVGPGTLPAWVDDPAWRQRLVACIAGTSRPSLRANTQDLRLIRELADENSVPWPHDDGIVIEDDPDLPRGRISMVPHTDGLPALIKDTAEDL